MSDQQELPVRVQINQLMRKAVPLAINDLSECEAATAELLEAVKSKPEWRTALFQAAAERLDQVIFGKGRDKSCVDHRRQEVEWLMNQAMETYEVLRNGVVLPEDPPHPTASAPSGQ